MPGTGYAVAVTPIARDGQPVAGAGQSIGVTTLPRSLPPPATPADLFLSAGPGSLTVSWSADPAELDHPVPHLPGLLFAGPGRLSVDREVRSYTITGLAPGVGQTVAVQALGPDLDADQSTRRTADGTPT